MKAYNLILSKLCEEFGGEDLKEMTTERILSFLNRLTEGRKQLTKRSRYAHLLAFFNFVRNNFDQNFRNPCETPMLKKLFRARPSYHWDVIEKEARSQKDEWRWMVRLYLRLLELEEEHGIRSPLLRSLGPEAEVYQAMGIVLERLERGPLAEKDVPALLHEGDGEFIGKVMKELRKKRLITAGKEFRKRMGRKGLTPKNLEKKD
jgi:hypothetical protein